MSSSLSTVDQSCHFIIKLPLKYYLEKAPRRKQVLRRRTLQRRKRSKPLNVQIPLAKLNNVQQLAAMRQATLPIVTVPSRHVRKTIQVTSCTTVIPLKQSDKVSAYDSHNHSIKDSNCSYPCDLKTLPVPSGVDRLSPNDQCGSRTVAKTLLQEVCSKWHWDLPITTVVHTCLLISSGKRCWSTVNNLGLTSRKSWWTLWLVIASLDQSTLPQTIPIEQVHIVHAPLSFCSVPRNSWSSKRLCDAVVRMRRFCGTQYTFKLIAGRTKGDGVLDTRRFVLKSLPKQQLVCLEVDLKNRTWTPFKVEAPPEFRTSLIQP